MRAWGKAAVAVLFAALAKASLAATAVGDGLPLTTHPARDGEPSVSPDGKWIAFASLRSGDWEIWVKRIDGGIAYRITSDPGVDRRPRWTHDGHGILFVSTRDDPEGDLFHVEVKRRGTVAWAVGPPRRLTPRFCIDTDPDPHPRGGELAFVSDRSGERAVWLLRLSNLHVRFLASGPAWSPRWSPDGEWLAWIGRARWGTTVVFSRFDARRDTLAGAPDTLVTLGRRPVLSFDFDPSQRYLACLLADTGSSEPCRTEVFLLPLPEAVSHRGRAKPSPTDSLPPRPYRLAFGIGPISEVGWRHGWLVCHVRGGDVFGIPFRGSVPVQPNAEAQLTWAEENAPCPSHLDRPEAPIPAVGELRTRLEALTRVLDFFPGDSNASATSLLRRACTWWLLGDAEEARRDLDTLRNLLGPTSPLRWPAELLEIDVRHVDPGKSILLPARVFGQLADTAEYSRLARTGDCPADLRRLALLRMAEMALSAGDSAAACRMGREVLAEGNSGSPWRAHAAWILLRACRPIITEEVDRLAALALEDAEPDAPLVQDFAEKFPDLCSGPAKREVDPATCLRDLSRRISSYSLGAAQLAWYLSAENAWRGRRWEEAIAMLTQLEAEAGDKLKPHVQLLKGMACCGVGDWGGAAGAFERVLQNPAGGGELKAEASRQLCAVLLRWADQLRRSGKCAKAIQLATQALRLAPTEPNVHRQVVELFATCGQADAAVDVYRSLHALRPEDPVIQYGFGLALSRLATFEARRSSDVRRMDMRLLRMSTAELEDALRKDYRLVQAYLGLAFNYDQLDSYRRVRPRTAGNTVSSVFRFAFAPLVAGYDWVRGGSPPKEAGELEKAIQLLRIGLDLNEERQDPALEAEFLLALGDLTYKLGTYSHREALGFYRERLRSGVDFPDSLELAEVLTRMGECALDVGEFDSAANYLQKAWSLTQMRGEEARALATGGLYAFACWRASRHREAISTLKALLRAYAASSSPSVAERLHRNLALAYLGAGELDSCLQHLTIAQELLLSGRVPDVRRKPVRIQVELLGWPFSVPFLNLRRFGLRPVGESSDLAKAEELALLEGAAWEALLRAGRIGEALRQLEGKQRALRKARPELSNLAPAQHAQAETYLLAGDWQPAQELFQASWKRALEHRDWLGVLANLEEWRRLLVYRGSLGMAVPHDWRKYRSAMDRTSRVFRSDRAVPGYWKMWFALLELGSSGTAWEGGPESAGVDSLVADRVDRLGRYLRLKALTDSIRSDTALARTDLAAASLRCAADLAVSLGDVEAAYRYWRELRRLGLLNGDPELLANALIEMSLLVSRMSFEQRRRLQVPWTAAELAFSGKELLLAHVLAHPPAMPEHRELLRTAYRVLMESSAVGAVVPDSLVEAYGKDLLTMLLCWWTPACPTWRRAWAEFREACQSLRLHRSGLGIHLKPSMSVARAEGVFQDAIRFLQGSEDEAMLRIVELLWPGERVRPLAAGLKEHIRWLLSAADASDLPDYPAAGATGPARSQEASSGVPPGVDSLAVARPSGVTAGLEPKGRAIAIHPNAIVPLFSSLEGMDLSGRPTLASQLESLLRGSVPIGVESGDLPKYYAGEIGLLVELLRSLRGGTGG